MGKKLTTEEFIEKARDVHGDRYDYSLTEYKKANEKVEIICKIHGIFNQLFYNHLKGQGCPKCKGEKIKKLNKDNKESFIEKANKTHGNIYEYLNVIYTDSKTKVDIVCKEHGIFSQTPSKHISGRGCQKCGIIKTTKSLSSDTKTFIEKARDIHNDTYTYNKVDYVNNTTEVIITCKEHGDFSQRPSNHLSGALCYKCGKNKAATTRKKSLERVLEEAKKVHGDKYDYSEVEYDNCKYKVTIICKQHGGFKQTMDAHLSGKGCSKCAKEQDYYRKSHYIKLSEYSVLYLVRLYNDNESFYKIGKSIHGAKKRLSKRTPYKLEIIKEYKTGIEKIYELEIELHKKYKAYKYRPLNKFIGNTECYTLDLPIQEIKKL